MEPYLTYMVFAHHPVKAYSSTRAQPKLADFLRTVHVELPSVLLAEQVHGEEVATITEDFTPGLTEDKKYPGARMIKGVDAMITDLPGIALIVRSADCVPVLIYDPVRKVVAAVHAGWGGIAAGIIKKTIQKLEVNFNSKTGDMVFGLGPAIHACCYAVKDDVIGKVGEQYVRTQGGKKYIDLIKAAEDQILKMNVRAKNIEILPQCSACTKELYSYRRDGKRAGRLFHMISLI